MSRLRHLVTTHGLDVLIVLAAVQTAAATATRSEPGHPTGALLWFEVVAVTATVLTLLWRTRFPFAAPAAMWLAAASLSFLDGRLIEQPAGIFVAGLGASVLLGNQPDQRLSRIGLVIVVGSATIVVLNGFGTTGDDWYSIPVLFGIGWLVGFALRERIAGTDHDLPFVAITGDGDEEIRKRSLAAGAVSFFNKPFDDEEILKAISGALNRCPTSSS